CAVTTTGLARATTRLARTLTRAKATFASERALRQAEFGALDDRSQRAKALIAPRLRSRRGSGNRHIRSAAPDVARSLIDVNPASGSPPSPCRRTRASWYC